MPFLQSGRRNRPQVLGAIPSRGKTRRKKTRIEPWGRGALTGKEFSLAPRKVSSFVIFFMCAPIITPESMDLRAWAKRTMRAARTSEVKTGYRVAGSDCIFDQPALAAAKANAWL